MKLFLLTIYHHLLIFSRVRIAVFFSFIFPLFIFILFSLIWGVWSEKYSKMLLTGVIIMRVTSDAVFSMGNVILSYYRDGLSKFFKCVPYSIFSYLFALVVSRMVITLMGSLLLIIVAVYFFDVHLSLNEYLYLLYAIICGFIIFSSIGLVLPVLSGKKDDISLANFVYFILLFVSDIFYPLSKMQPGLGKIISFLPMNPLVLLARGDTSQTPVIFLWTGVSVLSACLLFNKTQNAR